LPIEPVQWTTDGTLVKTATLCARWGCTRQALDQSRSRGDLVGMKILGKYWYPADFVRVDAPSVAQVCRPMQDVDPASQVIFWQRPHGDLGGCSIAETILKGQLSAAIDAARAFAYEHLGASSKD
jgi:hypothetical protein